ncbi:cyclic nucleotide-binding domain-containing protein [Chloroflexota bacterium]
MKTVAILHRCLMFGTLNEEQLKVVETMCTPEVFEPGEILCKQDTRGDKTYVITEGLVAIILELGPLTHRQVQSASNYDVVGWSSVIEPDSSTATVRAIERTEVLAFIGEDLRSLCATRPDIGCRISRGTARVVATRLRHAYTQLLGVYSDD